MRGEKSFWVYEMPESRVTPLMQAVQDAHAGITVFSLPSIGKDKRFGVIELGVKGPLTTLEAAFTQLQVGTQLLCNEHGGRIELTAPLVV
jgi:molybdopterin-biosynthesis enzyme MoeA-like protein